MQDRVIWTIGHSTHTIEEFISLLSSYQIELIADIRSYPGSGHYPHFNKESLKVILAGKDIDYIHLEGLGGRRKVRKDSVNDGWRHPAFRGYADYMETEYFTKSAEELEKLALEKKTAYMCAEALWWRCHRSMVSDWLKLKGWKVFHIMGIGKSEEHQYTQPARIANGNLLYSKE
jgi:uncharacterized protein (DUF488 family)